MKKILLSALAALIMVGCSPAEAISTNVVDDPPVRTAAQFIDENGVAYGIKQADNKLRVSSVPYVYDINKGNIPGHFSINKFGHNMNVAAGLETIWSGSNLYPYLTTADQLEVLSSDVDDTAAGTGARTIELFGLDANYLQIAENVTMNGTAFITTDLSFLRIYRAIVHSAGSSGWNEGTITIRDQDTDTTRAIVEFMNNQTLMAVFTIPAGHTGYITSWYGGSSFSKDTHIEMYVRPLGEVFQVKRHIHLFRQSFSSNFDFPEIIAERSDIELRAQASGGGGEISGGFFLWFEEN